MKITRLVKSIFVVFFSIGILALNAQSNVFELERFDEIIASGKVDIVLQEGDTESATVLNDDYEEPSINIHVNEGVLKINMVKSYIRDDNELKVLVTYRKLRRVKAQAGAAVESKNTIVADKLVVKVASGAEMYLEVETNDLDVVVSEGGIFEVEGKTESLDARASSGGQLEGFDLESDFSYITANTGGIAQVVANKKIEAKANTGGSIEYKGKPEKREFNNFLSGNIKRI